MMFYVFILFFFSKMKTEDELRISDWSPDVCSSDLARGDEFPKLDRDHRKSDHHRGEQRNFDFDEKSLEQLGVDQLALPRRNERVDKVIGRAACRERVCPYV